MSFVLITILTITLTSMLAYSTLFGQNPPNDVSFLRVEGEALNGVAGFMMFTYSGLLVVLNRRALPGPIRIGGYRLVVMGLVFVFFAVFSVLTIIDQIRENF